MMSGLLSDSSFNNSALPSPNSALCRSDTCAIRKPENAAGIRLPETVITLIINAVLPHTVQITKNKNSKIAMYNKVKYFLEILFFMLFPFHDKTKIFHG